MSHKCVSYDNPASSVETFEDPPEIKVASEKEYDGLRNIRNFIESGGSMVFTNLAGNWTVATRNGLRPVTDPAETAALDQLCGPSELTEP